MPVEDVPEPDRPDPEHDEEHEGRRHPPLREHEGEGGGDRREDDEPGEGLEPATRRHCQGDRGEGAEQDRRNPGRDDLELGGDLEEQREPDGDRRRAVEPRAREAALGGGAVGEGDPDSGVHERHADANPGRERPAVGEGAQEEPAGEDEEGPSTERDGSRDGCGIVPQHRGRRVSHRRRRLRGSAHPAGGGGGEPPLEEQNPPLHLIQRSREFRDLRFELGHAIGHVREQITLPATKGTR